MTSIYLRNHFPRMIPHHYLANAGPDVGPVTVGPVTVGPNVGPVTAGPDVGPVIKLFCKHFKEKNLV